ncbi:alpha-N-acetylglucosaminidase-like isoform X1 [Pollicipes pollicipes]|uniref:alpha-N-acetylglucosaminidase-like isoform X1 n=1 Tax=Pollicipes pollicipes TaxID=41117 RepID=UPI0018859D58|nr:alpha-N-acetylglucosaminidase-like isoform X1 [Pollicipes pollicipes]XP_037082681.1 alpha-N-acetylglucosaminidase-like isoform X1 [Pollicipes pollicipes]XP_037082682.1 alpha-N-acetylglucosaminidase-like isoform X1 [Pollicipes pollicipes]
MEIMFNTSSWCPALLMAVASLCPMFCSSSDPNSITYSVSPMADPARLQSAGLPAGGGWQADFSYPQLRPQTGDAEQAAAVTALLYRLIPDRAAAVSVQVDSGLLDQAGRDQFIVGASGGRVQVLASSGVAAAWGFHHYLKYVCHAHVSWDSDQLELPRPLPDANITVRANDRFRYYQNVCTVSYSSVWWGWARWQRELDWMALNGLNLALAFTGQEVIWRRVFMRLGLTKAEVDEFFSGPAFLAWNRMGNLQRWGGPLSEDWHQQQLTLAHQIIARMRLLGITPVLPAFAGHVPQNFSRAFPDSNVTMLPSWNSFNESYSHTLFLDPVDPLYMRIGNSLVTELQLEFNGTEHVYNCDSFNEMTPPSSALAYLREAGNATLAAMTGADPQAVWLMQGWLFLSPFWKTERAKAYLTSVPTGRMIVLDLYSEVAPVYNRFESYYGQPFVWCMLHNFGGQLGLQGTVQSVVKGPFEGRSFANSSMIGTGITMEGIFQNYVMYDLMLEMAWHTESPDPVQWASDYSLRRYGPAISRPTVMAEAWDHLMTSVYNHDGAKLTHRVHIRFITTKRPSLDMENDLWYNTSDLAAAWDRLVTGASAAEVRAAANLQHDLVDVTREVMSLLLADFFEQLRDAYRAGDRLLLQERGTLILELLSDMDEVLNTNKAFLLGDWLRQAQEVATGKQERKQYVYNALNQLTLWGPDANIVDYAAKQWAGLVGDYYRARWVVFVSYLEERLDKSLPYNQTELDSHYFSQVEQPFTFTNATYSHEPVGETAEVVPRMYRKYRPALDAQGAHARKQQLFM